MSERKRARPLHLCSLFAVHAMHRSLVLLCMALTVCMLVLCACASQRSAQPTYSMHTCSEEMVWCWQPLLYGNHLGYVGVQ